MSKIILPKYINDDSVDPLIKRLFNALRKRYSKQYVNYKEDPTYQKWDKLSDFTYFMLDDMAGWLITCTFGVLSIIIGVITAVYTLSWIPVAIIFALDSIYALILIITKVQEVKLWNQIKDTVETSNQISEDIKRWCDQCNIYIFGDGYKVLTEDPKYNYNFHFYNLDEIDLNDHEVDYKVSINCHEVEIYKYVNGIKYDWMFSCNVGEDYFRKLTAKANEDIYDFTFIDDYINSHTIKWIEKLEQGEELPSTDEDDND